MASDIEVWFGPFRLVWAWFLGSTGNLGTKMEGDY